MWDSWSFDSLPEVSSGGLFDNFDWGGLINSGVNVGVGLLADSWKQDAAQRQQSQVDAANAAAMAEQQRQFDAELAYKYAALAKAGGGGGGDPFAARKMALAEKQRKDALFIARNQQGQQSRQQQSEAIRNLVASLQYR